MKTCRRGLHQFEGPRCLQCKRETNRRCMRKWRANNIEIARERDRQRYADPTKNRRRQSRTASRKWRESHPEQSKAVSLKKRWANIEKSRAMGRRYQRANREKYAEAQRRRRGRKQNVAACFIKIDSLAQMLIAQCGRCYYCNSLLGNDKHLEHKTPLIRGGGHVLENLCWACPSCNRRKGTKTEEEFTAWLATMEVAA